jgi:lipopolysaccharide transport system permease protein
MLELFRYAWATRRTWWFLATARTRARFVRTVLGSFWLGVSNLLSISVLAIVYGTVFKVQNFPVYVVYLGLGLVTWNCLALAVGNAPNLFENNRTQLLNTNLKPVFYVFEEWAFQVQSFAQSLVLVLIGLSFFQHNLVINLLLYAIPMIINLLLFIFWLPLFVSLAGARFRDLYQLIPILLQLLFLLSPILYEKSNLKQFTIIADINPFYRILSPIRHALMHGEFEVKAFAIMFFFNLTGMFISWRLYKRTYAQLPFMV